MLFALLNDDAKDQPAKRPFGWQRSKGANPNGSIALGSGSYGARIPILCRSEFLLKICFAMLSIHANRKRTAGIYMCLILRRRAGIVRNRGKFFATKFAK